MEYATTAAVSNKYYMVLRSTVSQNGYFLSPVGFVRGANGYSIRGVVENEILRPVIRVFGYRIYLCGLIFCVIYSIK